MKEYTFGFSRHHNECWFHVLWRLSTNDTMHDYFWQPTLGMDGCYD